MELVVNEWLPEYLRPDAAALDYEKALKFLEKFLNKNDVLVVYQPSEFLTKVHQYPKIFSYKNPIHLKNFIKSVLLNSQKIKFISGEIQLQKMVEKLLYQEGTNFRSDEYLFCAASTTKEKIIVTTDIKLYDQMKNQSIYHVILLDEFLKTY